MIGGQITVLIPRENKNPARVRMPFLSGTMMDTAQLLSLRKIGIRTLTLSGSIVYSGQTAVSEGTLQVLGKIVTTNFIIITNQTNANHNNCNAPHR